MPQNNASLSRAVHQAVAQFETRVLVLALFVGSIWAVFIVTAAMPALQLYRHGVVPRTLSGLQGILFEPWLHASLGHIAANTGGLIVLGWFCMWPRISNFVSATVAGMLGGGFCAWLFGAPDSVHLGASGLVFAYAAYLVACGFYTRNLASILIAAFVGFSYGLTMLLGLLPLYPGVSWQSHVGGALGGAVAARLGVRKRARAAPR
ncbi:rhomboid family intramembrane serine protease [Paraburkholderia sp. 2C]